MKLVQTIKLAIKNIISNKMRSILTMLGIIIGTSSVIILVSIAGGSSKNITDQVQSLGTNLITVTISNRSDKKIHLNEIEEVSKLRGVKKISPTVNTNYSIKLGKDTKDSNIIGTNENFLDVRGIKLSKGRFLSYIDVENKNSTAVIGSTIASDLFGFSNPVGEEVMINGTTFKIIGVLVTQENSMGTNVDDMVLIPLTTAMSMTKVNSISSFYVQASDENVIDAAKNEIDAYLTKYLKSDGTNRTHNVTSQKQLLDTMGSITSTLSLLLGGIAGISLVVGGIGVMNVMLVSVTERTKEIGIRKALGGKRKDILIQFLVEALVITSIGGVIGIILGILGSNITNKFGMTTVISIPIIFISFTFSIVVGLIFGIFPAYKASTLKPIDALRYE